LRFEIYNKDDTCIWDDEVKVMWTVSRTIHKSFPSCHDLELRQFVERVVDALNARENLPTERKHGQDHEVYR
jgi:hypothetical protein